MKYVVRQAAAAEDVTLSEVSGIWHKDPKEAMKELLEVVENGKLAELQRDYPKATSYSVYVWCKAGSVAAFKRYTDGQQFCNVSNLAREIFGEAYVKELAVSKLTEEKLALVETFGYGSETLLPAQGYVCTDEDECQWLCELEPEGKLARFVAGEVNSFWTGTSTLYEPQAEVVEINAEDVEQYREMAKSYYDGRKADPLDVLASQNGSEGMHFGDAGYPYQILAEIVLECGSPLVPTNPTTYFYEAELEVCRQLCVVLPNELGEHFKRREVASTGMDAR